MKTTWDLTPLYKSDSDPAILQKRKEVILETNKFVKNWHKNSDYLKNPEVLKEALDEYENWQKKFGANSQEAYFYELKQSLDENNPSIKAKLNKAIELSQKIQNEMQFFEIRLSKVDEKTQGKFLKNKDLLEYKHFLEKLFAYAKHILSEPEEKIMTLKSVSSYDNWVRMLSGFLSKEDGQVINDKGNSETKNFSELTGLMNNQNKIVRDSAAKSFNIILEKHIDVAENELNSVLSDKKINDELRKFDRPDAGRHLADDIDTNVVDIVAKVVSDNFEIAQRYYELKTKLLGVKKLEYHERNVEYGKFTKEYSFEDTTKIIINVLEKLDGGFLKIFQKFLDEGRIDVFPQKGKKSGAFCTYGLITHPVYILLNHNGLLDDIRTLAHELGHGINDEFIKLNQHSLNFGTPTSTAEVSSTFFEDFVIQELIGKVDDETKLSLIMNKLNQDVSSIFRQIAFYNFETELHKTFREKGYLSKDEIGSIFQKHMASYMGPVVEQSEGSQNWWVYVSHFRYFFYVYSYASGLLISKSLQSSVKKDPRFIEKVKEFLKAGLSDSPKNIFSKLGVDITDKSFWEKGISEINNLLSETEKLAKVLSKI